MSTLVIDTSFGSTVGIVGHEPIYEPDSRSHVEKLQPNIARAIAQAGLTPSDITRIVVGTGPAPFTGLRAGIVAAKAMAFATGAELLGQNVLEPQAVWGDDLAREAGDHGTRHLVLAVNDARRRQLYYCLYRGTGFDRPSQPLTPMDIAYPDDIVAVANAAVASLTARTSDDDSRPLVIDVIGHGAKKYADAWTALAAPGMVSDASVFHDAGAHGPALVEDVALRHQASGDGCPSEPLYLRRPDVSVPNPLKRVLNHAGADKATGAAA